MAERDELDDELEALGRSQRERLAGRVDAWDRVAKGELPVDEVARERLAAGEDPAQVELAVKLFQPFDDDDDAAMAEALLRETETSEPEPDNVRRLPLRRWLVVLLPLAAALLAIWLWPRSAERGGEIVALDQRPLPRYSVSLGGGVEHVRGEPTAANGRVLAPETTFDWTLMAQEDTQQVMAVRVFAVPGQGPGRELELGDAIERSKTGNVRIAGYGRQLGLEPGKWRIVIALARGQAQLPATAEAALASGQVAWPLVDFEIEIIESASR